MFDSESELPSSSSSRVPPPLERSAVIEELMIPPTPVRHHTVEEDEHHTRLGEHAAVLWKFNKITDITVKLNEEKYPAHKTVLSCYSRYFKDMLLKSDKNVSVINLQLEAVTNESFLVLLRYMYTAELELTCQNIGDVYTAARKLGMDGAISTCTKILKGKERREVHSVYVFVTAKRLGLKKESEKALRSMCRRFEHIAGTQEFLDLTCEQLMEYLSQDELATRSEVIVFLSALKWLSVRFLDREPDYVRVLSCVRFPMMTLNEVLACHHPPLLPGIVQMPDVKLMLLTATCFVASKTINEERRFQRYDCPERTYLLERESIILWDPSIFDEARHALYEKDVAASTIQSTFRDYRAKKEKEKAAGVIQEAYRRTRRQRDQDEDEGERDEEQDDSEDVVSDDAEDKEREEADVPFAEKLRRSLTGFFRRSSQPESEDSEIETAKVRRKRRDASKYRRSNRESHERSDRRSPHWKIPYESTSIVEDLEERNANGSKYVEKDLSRESEDDQLDQPEDYDRTSKNERRRKKDLKKVEQSVAELAKSVDDAEEDTYGAVVISGGFSGDDEDSSDSGKLLIVYEPAAGEWYELGEMMKPRHHHRLAYLNGHIYCIGGCNPERTMRKQKMVPLRSCYSFDLASRTWAKIAEMRHCRVDHATAVLGGKIYVVGGKDEKDCMLDTVEVYDPDSNTWDEFPMGSPTIGAGVCSKNGKLWIIGGMSQDKKRMIAVSRSVQTYDPETKEWLDLAPLPFPRAFMGAAVCGDRVYVVGGSSHAGPSTPNQEMSSFDDVFFYDDDKKEWNQTTPLPSPRHFLGAVAVYKSLFVLGGLTSFKKEILDDILIYNEDDSSWVLSSHIIAPLCGFGAVAVPKHTLGL